MRIPILGPGLNSQSSFVTAKSMTNMLAEPRPQGEKSQLVAYGTPGLDLFVDFGATMPRGGLEFETGLIALVVHRGSLWEVNNAGTKTLRANTLLTTSGRVSMAHNGVQVMIVDGTAGYIYNTVTHAFALIVDADFPANPTTVCCISRRFVVSVLDSSRAHASDIDDGLSWDALNYFAAESSSDAIIAVHESSGQLILLGALTTEFWGNSGALDIPFTNLQGTANEWGLAARWSVAKFDNSFMALIRNRTNQVIVAEMNGYVPKKISSPDLDKIINRYASVSDATAYSYMLGGHPLYVISFPTAAASWVYDGLSGQWAPLKSFGLARHRGEFGFNLLRSVLVADYATGRLYKINADSLTDNGDSIEREVVSENIVNADQSYIDCNTVRLDVEVGVGLATGQGSDPQVGLQISRDNGKTWGAQRLASLGKVGDYKRRVEWRRCGTAHAFNFKFSITDPVKVAIVSACINPDD